MKTFHVTAVPHTGHDSYFRAGHRFGDAPVTIRVLDEEPKPDDERTPYVLSPAEFQRLREDKRIRIMDGPAPGDASDDGASATRAPAPAPKAPRDARRDER